MRVPVGIKVGDNAHSGDISHTSLDDDGKYVDIKDAEGSDMDQMMGFRQPLGFCKQHPIDQNIH